MANNPWLRISLLTVLVSAAGCASPLTPRPERVVTLAYTSSVPADALWSVEACGQSVREPRPRLHASWRGDEPWMSQDPTNPHRWWITLIVPIEEALDFSVRDPGLCRMASPPFGLYAFSGMSVNDLPLTRYGFDFGEPAVPCFGFRVTLDGRIVAEP